MAKNKILQAVVDIAGTVDPSLGKMANEAVGFLDKINLKAVAMGAAVGGIAVATGKAVLEGGKYLKDLGGEFDSAADSIRIGTGATGDALDGLLDDFDAIYKSVPTSMEAVGQSVADFNTRLGLTGPELQEVSKQALQVSDMLGDNLSTVIEESSQAFQQWDLDADAMGDAMDYIFKASQSTCVGFTDLMGKVQQFGPQLQDMGYSFEEAAALVGQLDKAGVNADEVLGALKKSVGVLAKEGISASDGLAQYVDQIENAQTAAEAASIASEVFGAKAGSTMAAAIRDGSLSISDLTDELLTNQETIAGAADDTYDFAERLQMMKQNLDIALKPLANTVFDGLNEFMPVLQGMLERVIPIISQTVDTAMPFVEEFLFGMADGLDSVAPMLADLAASLLPMLSELMANLLPPILTLMQELLPPLMAIVQAVLPPITSLLLTVLPIITQIASSILPILANVIAELLPIIMPVIEAGYKLLEAVVLPLIEPLMKLVEALLPPIIKLTLALMPALEPLMGILGPIAEILGTIVGWISKVIGWGADKISGIIGMFTGGGSSEENGTDGFGGGSTRGGGAGSGFAAGGFTDGFAYVGEDPSYPVEAVISFNPLFRDNNLDYWLQAGSMLGITIPDMDFFAAGGFTDGLAIAGEDPRYPTEAVISFNPAVRQQNLAYWAQTGQMLGASDYDSISEKASGGMTSVTYEVDVSFSPQVVVNSEAEKRDVIQQLREVFPEFVDLVEDTLKKMEAGQYVAKDSQPS